MSRAHYCGNDRHIAVVLPNGSVSGTFDVVDLPAWADRRRVRFGVCDACSHAYAADHDGAAIFDDARYEHGLTTCAHMLLPQDELAAFTRRMVCARRRPPPVGHRQPTTSEEGHTR